MWEPYDDQVLQDLKTEPAQPFAFKWLTFDLACLNTCPELYKKRKQQKEKGYPVNAKQPGDKRTQGTYDHDGLGKIILQTGGK